MQRCPPGRRSLVLIARPIYLATFLDPLPPRAPLKRPDYYQTGRVPSTSRSRERKKKKKKKKKRYCESLSAGTELGASASPRVIPHPPNTERESLSAIYHLLACVLYVPCVPRTYLPTSSYIHTCIYLKVPHQATQHQGTSHGRAKITWRTDICFIRDPTRRPSELSVCHQPSGATLVSLLLC
ncbi:hypothetical protein BKA81DRAFT_231847 [Phyllosticta paracitricarpa]